VTPLQRLLQEEIPVRPTPAPQRAPWTPEQQAQHRTTLLDAIDGWHWTDDTSLSAKRRHLRLIRDAAA
jgi:hypothetical protein